MFIRVTTLGGKIVAVAEEAIDWIEPRKEEPATTDLHIRGDRISVRETFEQVMAKLEPDPDF